jgi:hypothetical protein
MKRTVAVALALVLGSATAALARPTRLEGETSIRLPKTARQAMVSQGLDRAAAHLEVCVDGAAPPQVKLLQGTGFADADERITQTVKGWRFAAGARGCTRLAFMYEIARR